MCVDVYRLHAMLPDDDDVRAARLELEAVSATRAAGESLGIGARVRTLGNPMWLRLGASGGVIDASGACDGACARSSQNRRVAPGVCLGAASASLFVGRDGRVAHFPLPWLAE